MVFIAHCQDGAHYTAQSWAVYKGRHQLPGPSIRSAILDASLR